MSNPIPAKRQRLSFQAVLDALQQEPQGLSARELLSRLPGVSPRSLQRHLARGAARRHIVVVGRGRARTYLAAPGLMTPGGASNGADTFPAGIPLSADSLDILVYIRQPDTTRRRVIYQSDFLDAYRPNRTFYLSSSLRRQLGHIGQTSEHEAPVGTYSRAIRNRLLIDLSWASSHLEGNTYTRLDTRALIEQGRAASGKAAIETQMILNHKAAIELLVESAESIAFNRYTLLNLHTALSENLLPNPADEGRLRQHAVDIAKSRYRPLSTPQQIAAAFDQFLAKAEAIQDPFEQSFFAMVHLPYLQPFADMNKRTSRLAANIPLFRANLCPLTFLDVPQEAYSRAILGVYEMTRVELLRDVYVWAYERSAQEYLAIRQELAEPDPLRLAWRDFIKQVIRDVVITAQPDPIAHIQAAVRSRVPTDEQARVLDLIVEELRRLHEGVLARYGLRPSHYLAWRAIHPH